MAASEMYGGIQLTPKWQMAKKTLHWIMVASEMYRDIQLLNCNW